MNGWSDRRTDGLLDPETDGWRDEPTDRRRKEWLNGRIDGQKVGSWTDRQTDRKGDKSVFLSSGGD